MIIKTLGFTQANYYPLKRSKTDFYSLLSKEDGWTDYKASYDCILKGLVRKTEIILGTSTEEI